MSKEVFKCSPHASLEEAARQLWEHDVGCLVVVDSDDRPVGMITDRDILIAAYTRGITLGQADVSSAMANKVLSCSLGASQGDIEETMRDAKIRRMPVVDEAGKVAGIVTVSDLARSSQSGPLRAAGIPGVVKTLAAICEPRAVPAAAE
ncbi:MAG TPA: CBS domain-containing protein [Polyangiaceae bacterium]|nr:CBS domain-containing protein [Polyangiaceae bacterium]